MRCGIVLRTLRPRSPAFVVPTDSASKGPTSIKSTHPNSRTSSQNIKINSSASSPISKSKSTLSSYPSGTSTGQFRNTAQSQKFWSKFRKFEVPLWVLACLPLTITSLGLLLLKVIYPDLFTSLKSARIEKVESPSGHGGDL